MYGFYEKIITGAYMTTKYEFLIGLAERLKIIDICGLAKSWQQINKSEDVIDRLAQSDKFTVEEKVYPSLKI